MRRKIKEVDASVGNGKAGTNFQRVVELSNEHIALASGEGKILYSNGGVQKILGYSPEEYAALEMQKSVHPDDFPLAADFFRKIYAHPEERHMVLLRSLHKEGHFIWTEIYGTNLLHEQEVSSIIFQMRDAEARMKIQNQLWHYGKRMEILHEIDLGIINASSAPELIEIALGHIREIIPCEMVNLALIDWEKQEMQLFARSTGLALKNAPSKMPLPVDWIQSFRQENYKVIDDLDLLNPLPLLYQYGKANGARSYMHVILRQGEEVLGVLNLASFKLAFFTNNYREIAVEISNQLAIALRQLKLDQENHSKSAQLVAQVAMLEEAETALIQSEQRYRRVVEDQTDLICRYDADCRLRFVNKAYAETFGETPETMIGKSFLQWIPKENQEVALAHIRNLNAENPIASYEHAAVLPDGSHRWHQWTDHAIFDDAGNLLEYQGVGRDITDRKRAEEAEAQERRFRDALLGALAALSTSTDFDTVMNRILTQAAEVVPCDAGSIFLFEGDSARIAYSRGFSPEVVAGFKNYRMSISDSLLKNIFEGSYVLPDTHTNRDWVKVESALWIRSSIAIPITVDNRVIGVLTADSSVPNYFDFSHLDKLEAFALYAGLALERVFRLQELEEQVLIRTSELESILDYSFEPILLLGHDLQILRANPAFQELIPSKKPSFRDYVFPEDKVKFEAFLEKLVAEHGAGELEIRLLDGDDSSHFEAELSLSYVDVTPHQFVVTLRNITERKEHERQLHYHASLQENVQDAVIVTDMAFRIQSWNKAAEAIFGWKEEEILGRAGAEILQTKFDSNLDRDYYVNELRSKGAVTGEYVQHHRDGTAIHIFASTTIVKDEQGEPFAVISVNRDISERKKMELALNEKLGEELEFQSYLKALHDVNIELSKIVDLDELYKRAVQLGRERFGFERIGLLLYDEAQNLAIGTYGTDAKGNVVAEHHIRLEPSRLTGILKKTFENNERFVYEFDTSLFDNFEYIGRGWNAVATLWNGETSLGWLAVDNGIQEQKATKPLLDILALYAANLGSILSQKRTALALTESEKRFRSFMEDAPIAVVISNKAGEILLLNTIAEELLGYRRQELIGQSIDILVPEGQRTKHKGKRDTYTETPHKRTMGKVPELFVRQKNGGFFWADIQLSSIEVGDDLLIMSFIEDISERKLAEESLKLYASEVEDLYNKAPCGYHSLDANGLIVAVNDTELQWLGYEREDVLGRLYFTDVITSASQETFRKNFPEFKARGWVNDLEMEFLRKDGTTFFVSLSATAITDENGHFVMSRSTVFDVSERKEAQRLLEQALAKEKELGELKMRFVAMASHEFRTPLAVIKTSTDLVVRYGEKQGMDWSKEKLGRVSDQIEHLTGIMNDVLDMGRLQSGKIEFKPSLDNLVELCEKILDEFRARPDISHLFVEDIEDDLPYVMFDHSLMRQLISNLLSNAVKYSPNGKPVGLKLWQDEEHLVLEVHDKGIGIPEEDLIHLFEPFHRAANVGGIQGTGMGLSITKEIVEQHGGSIKAESQLGQGTQMIVRIPLGNHVESSPPDIT